MSAHRTSTSPSLVIRSARGSDGAALDRLAALDSAPAIDGPALIAEMNGRVVAAVAESGARVADPFERTAGLLEMLELRAAQSRAERRSPRRSRRSRRLAMPHLA
ncbi:MAG TPA: hypothetical protein VF533_00085 [Solirubrobacteraceae bacterium]|jgi:hypothetical protein